MKIIDLTHSFIDKMPVYPGDPEPSLKKVTDLDKEGYNDYLTVMTTTINISMPDKL